MLFNNCRTDLAHEANSRLETPHKGVESEELIMHGCKVSRVRILNAEAAEKLLKPVGDYYTLFTGKSLRRGDDAFSDTADALRDILRSFDAVRNASKFLVACLGNPAITPDAVGPRTADAVIVTRHLKSALPEDFAAFSEVSALRTGVLGTTGIESADELKAINSVVKPECIIVVDALAAGDIERLCRNIQVCDSGIAPGSGVANDRKAINSATMGVPVIAVGVPTVIDASAFSSLPEAKGLFVTPRNIDELVAASAHLIAAGINLALHPGLDSGDLLSLMPV